MRRRMYEFYISVVHLVRITKTKNAYTYHACHG